MIILLFWVFLHLQPFSLPLLLFHPTPSQNYIAMELCFHCAFFHSQIKQRKHDFVVLFGGKKNIQQNLDFIVLFEGKKNTTESWFCCVIWSKKKLHNRIIISWCYLGVKKITQRKCDFIVHFCNEILFVMFFFHQHIGNRITILLYFCQRNIFT